MQQNKLLELILNNRYRIWWHVLFWMLMYLDEILSLFGLTASYEPDVMKFVALGIMLDMILVYFNFYVLIPNFFLKGKYFEYALLTLLTIIINIGLGSIDSYGDIGMEFEDGTHLTFLDIVIMPFVLTMTLLGTAVAIKLFKGYVADQRYISDLKSANLETELAYLKDQINPHSLFNALNNIYVQSQVRPAEASESILLLSELLRYQLYDCAKEKVYLKDEINYLNTYLKLDALRKNKAKIEFKVNGTPNRHMVAPFLFIPFIENAVKHGMSTDNESQILIQLDIFEDGIQFLVENAIPKVKNKVVQGGIGLKNVQRRLELLYPDRHDLTISDNGETYQVKLVLQPSLT